MPAIVPPVCVPAQNRHDPRVPRHTIRATIDAVLAEAVALVTPPRCAACAEHTGRAADVLCAACRRALPWLRGSRCERCALPLPHARGRCPARDAAFDGAWAAVAYEGVARDAMHALKFAAARPLARVMAAQIAANAPPALLGATPATTLVAVPPHPRRRRARGFDPANLRFAARGPAPPRVVLVDDVHTTGATLSACAAALRQAGSEHVAAITWARTLDERLR